MFYLDEFKEQYPYSEKSKVIFRIFKECGFHITLGTTIIWSFETRVMSSIPNIQNLSLGDYEKIIVYLVWEGLRLPSYFNKSLGYFDNYFSNVPSGPIAVLDLVTAEKLYIALCQHFGEKTKSKIKEHFCKICEIPLSYEVEKCWACERGI